MAPPIPADHGILFDRRLPEPLLAALSEQGHLAGLGQIILDTGPDRAADLGLRGNVKSRRNQEDRPRSGRVTLYVGTTMAAHLYARTDGRVKLEPQHGTQLADQGALLVPFDPSWNSWQHPQKLQHQWSTILEHLEEVIRVTPQGRLKEGKIQASLTRLATDFAIVDREVVLSHEQKGQRSAVRKSLRTWVKTVVAAATGALPPSQPESFGNKLDALGVDKEGRLLVIEVKPATELNGTAWTPLQVSVYQHLLSAWLESAPDEAMTVVRTTASVGPSATA